MTYIPVAHIQEVTARTFRIDPAVMTAPNNRGEGHNRRNARHHSHPRQVAMYLAWELTPHSKSRIGQLFGGRDHTTVIHAIEAVKQRMASSNVLRNRVERISEKVRSAPVDKSAQPACPVAPVESSDCPMEQKPKRAWVKVQAEERKSLGIVYRELLRADGPKIREEDRVHRDPCIKCGTRADIGCVHTRIAA